MEGLLKYVVGALLAGGVGWWALKWFVGFAAEKWVKPLYDKLSDGGKKNAANAAAIAKTLCTILTTRFPDAQWDDLVAALVAEFIEKTGIKDEEAATRIVYEALVDSGKMGKLSSTAAGLKTPETIKLRTLHENKTGLAISTVIDESKTDR